MLFIIRSGAVMRKAVFSHDHLVRALAAVDEELGQFAEGEAGG